MPNVDGTLESVAHYLKESNAAEELILDEISSHHYTLASPDSKDFISQVPSLLSAIGDILNDLVSVAKDIVNNSSSLLNEQREQSAEENRRESGNADNSGSKVTFRGILSDIKDNASSNFLTNLLFGATFLVGTVVGAFASVAKLIKLAFKDSAIGVFISKIVNSISDPLTKIFTKVSNFFKGISDRIGQLFKLDENSKLAKGLKSIREFFSKIVRFFNIGEGFSKIGETISKVLSKFKFFFKLGKSFGKLLGPIGLVIMVIDGLINTVTGAIEGFKTEGIAGAIKGGLGGLLEALVGSILDMIKSGISWIAGKLGFENVEKFLDSFSFSDMLKNLVNIIVDSVSYFFDFLGNTFSITKFKDAFDKFGLLGIGAIIGGGLADMLKGAVSWILTLLGATDWASALDRFSFQDLYKGLLQKGEDLLDSISEFIGDTVDSIVKWFKDLPDKIADFLNSSGEKIAEFGLKMADMAEVIIKKILQQVLPRKNSNAPWWSPTNLASSAIPSDVYKFAGINPDTGEIIESAAANVSAMPRITPDTVNTTAIGATTIINNNISRGGDVNNVSNSNVNQNLNSAAGPIITGSAMGLYAV